MQAIRDPPSQPVEALSSKEIKELVFDLNPVANIRSNLLKVLDGHAGVTVIHATEDIFLDWDMRTSELYSDIKNLSNYHVFQAKMSTVQKTKGKVIMTLREYANSAPVERILHRRGVKPDSAIRNDLLNQKPPVVSAPGISLIKKVELYQKWRPLLPPPLQAHFCEKPSDNDMARVREYRRQQSKRRKPTSESPL